MVRFIALGLALITVAGCDGSRVAEPARLAVVQPPEPIRTNMAPPVIRAIPPGTILPILSAPNGPLTPDRNAGVGPQSGKPKGLDWIQTSATAVTTNQHLIWAGSDGGATIWKMYGSVWTGDGATVLQIPSPWRLAATGDLNGDTHPDFIWENTSDGMRAVTFMNGPAYGGTYQMMFQFPIDWRIVAAVDFDANGKPDLVVHNTTTGQNGVVYLNGAAWTGVFAALPQYALGNTLATVGDMTGDGKPDLIFNNIASDSWFISILNGTQYVTGAGGYSLAQGGRIAAVGDFTFDGKNDLVWQNILNGERRILPMNGTQWNAQYTSLPVVATSSTIVSAAEIQFSVLPLNLTLGGFYLVQNAQDLARSVPLVAGRDATARVFVVANDFNSSQPVVTVRITPFGGATSTFVATRSGLGGVALGMTEAETGNSYDVVIPGALIQPGVSAEAVVDPANIIPETNEADNSASGPVSVRAVNRLDIRFVPVRLTGGELDVITAANIPNYIGYTMKLWPLQGYNADVHAVFNSAQSSIGAYDGWNAIALELLNLRTAEGNPPRYYHGIIPRLSSPVAGVGYVGLPVALSFGMQNATDSSSGFTVAHELGHNFNRPHSPGCGAADPDPLYPNSTGNLDVYAYDGVAKRVYPPSTSFDIMSYCSPRWVSGFNVRNVFDFRATSAFAVTAADALVPSLLIWGHISANGVGTLEPSFEVVTRPNIPIGNGKYRIEGLDDAQEVLFSYAVDGSVVGDGVPGERQFSFAIPLASFNLTKLKSMRIVGGSGRAIKGRAAYAALAEGPADIPVFALERAANRANALSIRWNSTAHPMVMIREAATGQVIAFARGGAATFLTRGGDLEFDFSNGVRSTKLRRRSPE